MLFGQLEPKALEKANLSLPKDHTATKKVLAKAKKSKPEILVGCAKWGRPDWVGKIYPKGTKAADFLEAYGKQFNCIEFNAIFYKLPDKKEVLAWKSKVGKDFKFFPKFTEVITHRKRLKNVQNEVDAFLNVVSEFGSNLGPLFLMPHPQMGPKHKDTILEFIDALPKDVDLFTEFRHPEMFTQPHLDEMFDELEKRKCGVVITDAAGRRDCVHMRLTTPEVFVRFVGNSLHPTDYTRIDEWVDRIGEWIKQGLQKCYFFMHQHEELYSPELCKYLIEQMNKKLGTKIAVPRFVQSPVKPSGKREQAVAKPSAKKEPGSISRKEKVPVKTVAAKKPEAKKTKAPLKKEIVAAKKTTRAKPAKKPVKKTPVKKPAKKRVVSKAKKTARAKRKK